MVPCLVREDMVVDKCRRRRSALTARRPVPGSTPQVSRPVHENCETLNYEPRSLADRARGDYTTTRTWPTPYRTLDMFGTATRFSIDQPNPGLADSKSMWTLDDVQNMLVYELESVINRAVNNRLDAGRRSLRCSFSILHACQRQCLTVLKEYPTKQIRELS